MRRLFIFRNTIFCLCVACLNACVMYMPAARDDFSVMGNDPFSNLIREGRFEKGDATAGRSVGVSMIDIGKVKLLAQKLLVGKSRFHVTELFSKFGDGCISLRIDAGETRLNCEVRRQWKLKNIGAPFDTSVWHDPAVKLVFSLHLSPSDEVTDIELQLTDVSVSKSSMQKP